MLFYTNTIISQGKALGARLRSFPEQPVSSSKTQYGYFFSKIFLIFKKHRWQTKIIVLEYQSTWTWVHPYRNKGCDEDGRTAMFPESRRMVWVGNRTVQVPIPSEPEAPKHLQVDVSRTRCVKAEGLMEPLSGVSFDAIWVVPRVNLVSKNFFETFFYCQN